MYNNHRLHQRICTHLADSCYLNRTARDHVSDSDTKTGIDIDGNHRGSDIDDVAGYLASETDTKVDFDAVDGDGHV